MFERATELFVGKPRAGWQLTQVGNHFLEGGGKGDFYVSYNNWGYETALCCRTTDKFYILEGDWREQYEKLAPKGLKACLQFYKRHVKTHRSQWSIDA